MTETFAWIRKHFSLLGPFFKASVISELEFRFNIASRFFTDIIWYVAQLSIFEVIYRHTTSLSGWSLEEMRVFMGVLFVTDALYMMLFAENLDRLGEKIRKGDLDLLLVKPVNSQWMLSVQKISIAYAGNFVVSAAWLGWAISKVPGISLWNSLWLLITVPTGIAVVYTIRFSTAATALFFTRADAINYIWYQLYRLGTRPDSIYPSALRYAVLTVLPIAFLASVPAQVILGKSGPVMLLWGAGLAVFMIYLSNRIWKRGLESYSSASS